LGYSSGRAHGCRITQFAHRSLTQALKNDFTRATLLADKGADSVEFHHKPTDTDFLLKERAGIREPGRLGIHDSQGFRKQSRLVRGWLARISSRRRAREMLRRFIRWSRQG
jgi:hypothetical protein